jgi:hypothetical protein
MLSKTTELFNKIVKSGGVFSAAGSDTDLTQLGVCYRGSSIIGEDDIREAFLHTTETVKLLHVLVIELLKFHH